MRRSPALTVAVEEKAGQLTQCFYFRVPQLPEGFEIESLPPEHRMFLEQPKMVEAATGDGFVGSALFVTEPATIKRLPRTAGKGTRLGIPLLFGFDVIHGLRTIFPVPVKAAPDGRCGGSPLSTHSPSPTVFVFFVLTAKLVA